MPAMLSRLVSRLTILKPVDLFPKPLNQTRFQRFSGYAAARIILALLFFAPVIAISNLVSIFVLDLVPGLANLALETIRSILTVVFVLLAYRLYCRKIEHREAKETSLTFSMQEWGWGFMISFVLMLVLAGSLVAGGMYQIKEMAGYSVLIKACYIFIAGAFLQEMLFRVLLFKIVEEYLGSLLTIVVTAAFFTLMHMGNANSSAISSGTLFLSDFLLSAIFVLTRRVWMVWGMHAGWNFIQDGVLGMPNSGIDSFPSLIKPIVNGPVWLTGGKFGLESSLLSVVLSVVCAILVLMVAYKHQQILLPNGKETSIHLTNSANLKTME